jgi:hypothetical protein
MYYLNRIPLSLHHRINRINGLVSRRRFIDHNGAEYSEVPAIDAGILNVQEATERFETERDRVIRERREVGERGQAMLYPCC